MIFPGDFWSMDIVSHHVEKTFANKGYDNIASQFQDQKTAFQNKLLEYRHILPEAQFVFIMGNHEAWLDDYCQSHPQLDKPSIESTIKEVIPDAIIKPQGSFYNIGHLSFCHGDNFGSPNPAKQAVERCKQTVILGHFHTWKVWSDFSMVDDAKKYIGVCVPGFTPRSPEYGRSKPNQWLTGFYKASVKKSGNYSGFVFLVSPQGHFMTPDGREYS